MSKPRRILVVKLSALGDLFHAVPVVHRLSEHFECKIDWVTQPEYVQLVRCHRDVDRVIAFPRRGGLDDSRAFLRALRVRRYDLALDLQGLTKSGLVLGLCRASRKIGSSHPRELAKFFAGETPPARPESVHAMDRLFDSLCYLGIEPAPVVYPLDFPEFPGLPEALSPLVALAPKSRWPAKDWPLENYAALGGRLIEEMDARIWVLGGPEDRGAGERLCLRLGERAENFCGTHPLLALGPLLQKVDCLVSNDSGPMHFAAALGTPQVALFGPTDPKMTGPRGGNAAVLRPPPDSGGYPDHRSYKLGDTRWIERIKVDQVFDAVRGQLKSG